MISYVTRRYEQHARGRVAYVEIDNQKKLNSLSSEVMSQFIDVFRNLSADPALRAVVLSGAGDKAFIGGANIDEMAAVDSPEAARAFILKVHGCCQAIRDLPVPVIAAVDGWCLGAGLEVAAACDMRLCSDQARFGMPEVRLGIPSVVEAALLPALIGWGRTRRILMTGEIFGAGEALAWGLVEEVYLQAAIETAVEDLLEKLLEAEPRAVQLQKTLIQQWEELPTSQAIAAGVDAFEDAWTTDEPKASMAKYLAERAQAKGR
ncbi:MAG: enoyl-CoA hydratase [Phenylobacterium sp.]|uniref:enoyl-CoA hydratase n=1 Tax=Phenylobacterium sp. TaxID=1871053 RepID=UPI00261F8D92|nr:enoyl-CoA hydratase [Phenylobacterium sp.]MDB5464007.1 enoyl-CoA hydratase [Phenylobacterium sp.]MDB5499229.1 enoyl-CoA hydratase [Phenylobacterium sp.]